jgi:hypothetical protein
MKKAWLLLFLVLNFSVSAQRRSSFITTSSGANQPKTATQVAKTGGEVFVASKLVTGNNNDNGSMPPQSQSVPSVVPMLPAPGGNFFSSPVASGKPDVNSGNVKKIEDDLRKKAEEMGRQAFSDGYSKGFSQGFDGAKGGKSVPVAHPVAPANPADQAILAKMGPLVTDDLKKQVEEKRQKAFADGYSKGFAEGQKAAASQKLAKSTSKGQQQKEGETSAKKSVIKLPTAPAP